MIDSPTAPAERASAVPLEEAYMLVRTAIDSDRADEAEQVAQAMLDEWPDDVHTNLLMGEVQLELGRYDAARQRFERALEADPEDPNAHLGLAVVREALGDLDGAVQSFRTVLRLDPSLAELRPHMEELVGEPVAMFDSQSLVLQRVRSGDWLAAVGESYGLSNEELSEPWLEAALVQALWGTGRAAEACSLATAQRLTAPSRLRAALVIAWKRWLDGDVAGAEALLNDIRPYDPVGRHIRSYAHMAPAGWRAPEWHATVHLPDAATGDAFQEDGLDAEEAAPAAFAAEAQSPVAEPIDPEYTPFSEPAEPIFPPQAYEEEQSEGDQAIAGSFGTGEYIEPVESAWVAEPQPFGENDLEETTVEPVAEEPSAAPGAVLTDAAEPELSLPEAPASPTDDVPTEPELPDLPSGAGVEQPDVQPDRQPFEAPQPEITDVPPSYTPEMPATVPSVPGVSTPGTTPPSPMGEASALDADALLAAGQYEEALDAYGRAVRDGTVSTEEALPRLVALADVLAGKPKYHRLLGDLYKRRGMARRALKEYELAMGARLRRE